MYTFVGDLAFPNSTQEMTKDEDFKLFKIQVAIPFFFRKPTFVETWNLLLFFYYVIVMCFADLLSQSEHTLWRLQAQSEENPSKDWRFYALFFLKWVFSVFRNFNPVSSSVPTTFQMLTFIFPLSTTLIVIYFYFSNTNWSPFIYVKVFCFSMVMFTIVINSNVWLSMIIDDYIWN